MNVDLMQMVDDLAISVSRGAAWFVAAVWNNPDLVKYGMLAAAIVTLLIVSYLIIRIVEWLLRKAMVGYREISFHARRAWHWLRKRPSIRAVEGKFMAKWKNGIVADKLGDAIFDLEMSGILSEQEATRANKKIGKALGLTDLLPRRFNKMWLRYYFLGSKNKEGKSFPPLYQKLAGPAKPIPGPKPGEEIPVAPVAGNVVNSDLLNRIRAKKQQAA